MAAQLGADQQSRIWARKILDSLDKKEFADVIFQIGPMGDEVFAHKLILCAGSPVFETMFNSRWNAAEKLQNVQLPDVEPVAFRLFLKFIYNQCKVCGKELRLTPVENLLDLIYIARKYDVQTLVDDCLQTVQYRLDVDNAIAVYQQAQDFGEVLIESSAFEFIVRRLPEILETNNFNLLRQQNLLKILAIDDLDIKEVSLFQAACRWAAAECKRLNLEVSSDNYRKVLGSALDLIRFPTMKSEDLTFQVANCGILTSDEMVEILKFVALPPEQRYKDRKHDVTDQLANVMIFLGRTNLPSLKYNVNPRHGYQNDLRLIFCKRHGIFEHIYILHSSSWFQTCFKVNRKIKIKGFGLSLTFHDALAGVFNVKSSTHHNDRMDTDDIFLNNNNSEERIEVNLDISQTDNSRKCFATCAKVCRQQVRVESPSLTYVGFDQPVEIEPQVVHTISYMFVYKQADLSHHLTSLGDVELNVSPVEVRLNDAENVKFEFLVTKGNDHPYLECPIREIAFCL